MPGGIAPTAIALTLAASLFAASSEPYRLAMPSYHYRFPRDYFNHPEYRTEWWYYTGNLHASDGRRFGFELTFFRQAVDRDPHPAGVWDVRDVWLAHLAVSDIDGGRFFHDERLNRSGAGIAGADEGQARVWNGNWQVRWVQGSERLQAVSGDFRFDLDLAPDKPPAIHGVNGVSQKSEGLGRASHYFSQTRLRARGALVLEGKPFAVEGLAWMDHEFFSQQLAANQAGWDWFSLQFDDGSELMLYRLRLKDGSADPYSAGTYIDAQGHTAHLKLSDFSLSPGAAWISPDTGGKYPVAWTIRVPSLGLDMALSTRLSKQELTGSTKASPAYWEGAIEVMGTKQGRPAKGVGYLEMTGYAGAVTFGG